MVETPGTNYQSFTKMPRVGDLGLGRIFYVYLAGNTNGAHNEFVKRIKSYGHTEVNSPDVCDYVLVFCPIASRVAVDIRHAMSKAPADKPIILVVMHHTFSPEYVLADSRNEVSDPIVRLTVDCLFYEDEFLKCTRNDISWHDVQTTLGLSQISSLNMEGTCWTRRPIKATVVVLMVFLLLVVVFIVLMLFHKI